MSSLTVVESSLEKKLTTLAALLFPFMIVDSGFASSPIKEKFFNPLKVIFSVYVPG